ncbi:MAG: anaerobic sulfatase maturase [Candidatus Sigynarchaeota archaeon]
MEHPRNNQAGTWPPPGFHVMIKPAGASCNLACQYCFYLPKKALYPGKQTRMDDAVLEAFTRQYIEAQAVPEVTFGWQGGEPLLMGLDFFKKAIFFQQKYKRPGIKVSNTMQTNGTLLDDAWGRFLHDNGFLVGISIDGPPAIHDMYRKDRAGNPSFKRVRQGVNVLKRHHVDFNVLCCVHAGNEHHPVEVYTYLRDAIKAQFVQFIPVVEREGQGVSKRSVSGQGWGSFLIGVFNEWVRHDVGRVFVQTFDAALASWMHVPPAVCVYAETCGAALALEHNGDMYACDHYVDPAHFLGNIMVDGLKKSIASAVQERFGLDKRDKLPRQCIECDYLFACNGECPRNRIKKEAGSGNPVNHLCEGYKAFFAHVDPYMRFMAWEVANARPAANVMARVAKGGSMAVEK